MRKLAAALTISAWVAGSLSGCAVAPAKPAADNVAKPAADNAAKKAEVKGGRRSPIVGMLDGPLAGGITGRYADEESKDLKQTTRDYGYTPSQGSLVAFDFVRANPAVVPAGESVNINTEYAVLLPVATQVVNVTETREFFKDGVPAGKVSIEVERVGGSYKSTVPFTIPSGAAAGNYEVKVSIEAQNGAIKDSKGTYFKVTR